MTNKIWNESSVLSQEEFDDASGPLIHLSIQALKNKEQVEPFDIDWCINAPGDLIDRLSIVYIKLSVLDNPSQRTQLEQEKLVLTHLYRQMAFSLVAKDITKMNELISYVNELLLINCQQWKLEDDVRSAKTLEETGAAALASRKLNTKRVDTKNKINKLLGFFTEEKLYKENP